MSSNMRVILASGLFIGAVIGAMISMIFTNEPTFGILLGAAIGCGVAVPVTLDLDGIEA